MRNLTLLFVFLYGSCMAQSVGGKLPVPDSKGVVYLFDPSNQTLKPLPEERWSTKTRSYCVDRGFGCNIGKNDISLDISGDRSPLRIANNKPELVFISESPESARLFASTREEKDKKRRIFLFLRMTMKRGAWAPSISGGLIPGIPVVITQFGDHSFKLVPESPLNPGEYAVLAPVLAVLAPGLASETAQSKNHRIFTFGVDADPRTTSPETRQ